MRTFDLLMLFTILMLPACEGPSNNSTTKKDNDSMMEQITETLQPPLIEQPTDENRYAWQKPELVIEKIGNIEGKVIADIGAGTGYFAFRLIRNAKKVIAIEIDPDMINLMEIFRQNLDSVGQAKIETRLALESNPMLSENEVDIAVIINTIGYIEDRKAYLSNLRKSLKSGGQVIIVDFKMKRIPDNIAPSVEYRVNLLDLENLLLDSGYKDIITDDTSLDYQYIVKATGS